MKCFFTVILYPCLVFAYSKESNLTLLSQLRGKMDNPDPNVPDQHMVEQNWKSAVNFKISHICICNGGLITDKHVITVLSCIIRLRNSKSVRVYLGIAFGGQFITSCTIRPLSRNRGDHHLQIALLENPQYQPEHAGLTPVSDNIDEVVRRAVVASSTEASEFIWSHVETDSRNPEYIYERISDRFKNIPTRDLGALLFFHGKLVAIGLDTVRRSIIDGCEVQGLFIRYVKIAPNVPYINNLLPEGMSLTTQV